MAAELLPIQAQGFRAFKIGWGPFGRRDNKTDEAMVRAAREAIGSDSLLMVSFSPKMRASLILQLQSGFVVRHKEIYPNDLPA